MADGIKFVLRRKKAAHTSIKLVQAASVMILENIGSESAGADCHCFRWAELAALYLPTIRTILSARNSRFCGIETPPMRDRFMFHCLS